MKMTMTRREAQRQGLMRKGTAAVLAFVLAAGSAWAADAPAAPTVDLSALPSLGDTWRETNPYRGDPRAVEIGREAYLQSCAACHGTEFDGRAPAANLSRVDAYCRRIADAAIRDACMRDNDAYFVKSVREGKERVGLVHMPPWEGVLPQEVVWAIQTYVESRAK